MNAANDTYQKLDRAAQWLLFGEFAGTAFLFVIIMLMFVGNMISPNAFDMGNGGPQFAAVTIGGLYGSAYLANLTIGIAGLYIHVTERREGYPGTGQLLNWVLLAATIVIVVFVLVALFSSL